MESTIYGLFLVVNIFKDAIWYSMLSSDFNDLILLLRITRFRDELYLSLIQQVYVAKHYIIYLITENDSKKP